MILLQAVRFMTGVALPFNLSTPPALAFSKQEQLFTTSWFRPALLAINTIPMRCMLALKIIMLLSARYAITAERRP